MTDGAGQPGKNVGDDAGLVGRSQSESSTSPSIDHLIHRIRRALRLCRGCNESRFHARTD